MKSKFIKSTIILLLGGIISKILGMIIKIVLTRSVTEQGIGLYMLVLPTFNLFITLCTLGMPVSISKLVSENRTNNKKLVLSIVPISLLFNLFLIIILFIISPYISKYLLCNSDTYYPLLAIGLTLPFICISSIIKGYFFGKERMFPQTLSNIIEQLVRLLLIIYFIPKLLVYGINIAITGVVLINILSEFASIIVLLFFIPKGNYITISDFKYNKQNLKDTLNISIPTTGSRLIGSLTYFLEPIILTYILLKVGYTNDYITLEYGIINGYVYPLLLLPSFFTLAVSNAILPIISNSYSNKKYSYARKKVKEATILSLTIGIPITIIFMLIPDILLKIIYNTTLGVNYVKFLAPFFLLYYIQSPLTAALQAMGKAKCAMIGTLMGSIIRLLCLTLISFLKVGMLGLIISTVSNMLFVTLHHLYYTNKYLKRV
jgi:stage V sporulation protein B